MFERFVFNWDMSMTSRSYNLLRGQLTLEFLILFAVFLSILGLWIPVMDGVKTNTEQTITNLQIDSVLTNLIVLADEICILGPGNKRTISFSFLEKILLRSSGHNLELIKYNSKDSVGGKTRCSFVNTELNLNTQKIFIVNKNGKISLSNSE